jgi:hypothetical protein
MGCQFEFDPVNRILLAKIDGPLTSAKLAEYRKVIYRCFKAVKAASQIIDFSAARYELSTEEVRDIAREQSHYESEYPRAVISPTPLGYGLSRLFQMVGQDVRPGLMVVRTFDEALDALKVRGCRFEVLPETPGGGDIMDEAS